MSALASDSLIRPGIGTALPEEEAPWVGWVRLFAFAFLGLVGLAIIGALTDSEISRERSLVAAGVGLAYGAWMWRRGQWTSIRSNGDALLYFGVSLALLVIALRLYDGFGLVIFGAYWQGFAYFRLRPAMAYTVILTILVQFGFSDVSLTSLDGYDISLPRVLFGVIGLMVAGLMAAYIESLGREAERRRILLHQLREAQDALARTEREAGMQQERQRLAGEIHDTVAQHFTSIVTNLEAAESRSSRDADAAWGHIRAAREAARQGIADARAMVGALQPAVLQGRAIGEALRETATSSALPVTFREEGQSVTMGRERETILLRALQEALQNARKHAAASEIAVTLTWLEDEVILDVQDDGRGFTLEDVPPPRDGHRVGLATMRHRVESAGGTWMLESSPGEGTSLAISFPLDRMEASRD